MTPIALIEAAATLLWTYTALTFGTWLTHLRRLPQGAHIAAVTELLSHLVPAMILLVLLVLFGALIGLPSVVAFIAILFPAGTAYGTHTALIELRDTPQGRQDLPRFIATLLIGTSLIAYRHLA
ncbi:hypothetical protein [Gymnodinialimonas sp.]